SLIAPTYHAPGMQYGQGMARRPSWRLLGALVLAAFTGGVVSARVGAAAPGSDPYRGLAVFARVLGYVERNYVDPIPLRRLLSAAIRGVVSELDGPSAYLDPPAFEALKAEARPEFGGVGVDLALREREIVVVAVHADTPAARAGVRLGEILRAVDGAAVARLGLPRVADRIKGVPGTTVELDLERAGQVRTLALVRSRIYRSTASGRRLGPLGYLRLVRFDERSARDVVRGLDGMEAEGRLEGLILDLRGNPGGLLNQAVAVSDLWLREGPIVTTRGRDRGSETLRAVRSGTEPRYPLAVLVDEGTASAAEIVAGALQDQRRARVFGRRTFGKGSVQTLIELEDRSALKLTVARYLTPSGRSIDGSGIEPDVIVPTAASRLGSPGSDPALDTALTWLRTFQPPGR
ncbi:MAG: S41 family peptidase, partial [Myxococcota bacterium]